MQSDWFYTCRISGDIPQFVHIWKIDVENYEIVLYQKVHESKARK